MKLLGTGTCANIIIREIMLINIISSASWTLQYGLSIRGKEEGAVRRWAEGGVVGREIRVPMNSSCQVLRSAKAQETVSHHQTINC